MRLRTIWLGAALAGVLVWFASPELRWPARLLTAVLLGPAPVAFMLQGRAAESLPRPLPRIAIYTGTIIGLWLLGLTALGVALISGFTPRMLGLVPLPASQLVIWTLVGSLAAGLVVGAFKVSGFRDTGIMRDIVPVTAREKAVFTALSITAGICEELTFRGFLLLALGAATGSLAAGVALSSLAFGVLHAHQHAGGATRAALLGAVLAAPLIVTGSVYPSMAAHAIVDIVGGLWVARWLFR
jgi:membrane protease YdiL (CAAX protease family)